MNPKIIRPLAIAAFAALLICTGQAAEKAITPTAPIVLFNGHDLTGWTPYAKEGAEVAAATWKVVNGVIQCTGKPNGYLRSAARYQDYVLTVEWRWVPAPMPVDKQGRPRNRNNGVLLHMQGTDNVWPKSLEAQLMENNAGDFYVIGGVETKEWAAIREKAVAAAGTDAAAVEKAKNNRRIPKQQPSSEKPTGEWNTYNIVCRGDTVTVSVNGVQQNQATGLSVREGHILLQSEGAPIEFRNVRLDPLQ